MYSPQKKLDTPTDFGFPYEPYDIQQQLMQELFQVIERKQIGIFESPTGTGKSLTLTCGALSWLEQHEALVRTELLERIASLEEERQQLKAVGESTTNWFGTHTALLKQREELMELHELRELLYEHERQLADIKGRHAKARADEQKFQRPVKQRTKEQVPQIGECFRNGLSDAEEDEESMVDGILKSICERFRDVQIFYCSRTHSQLAQVVAEIGKTRFRDRVRCITLGSRQQLCINEQVRRLPNIGLMNERCLDMAKSQRSSNKNQEAESVSSAKKARKSPCKCHYKSAAGVHKLSDRALCALQDIEDLVAEGKRIEACPYYAARSAQPNAQLVLLPYQLLLRYSTRQKNDIDIRGAIVIIDEAHNLLDTIAQLHSCELSLRQLVLAHEQMTAYKLRYAKQFSTANLLRINQLLYVVKRLCKMLETTTSTSDEPSTDTPADIDGRMVRTYELTAEGDFYNIDLFAVLAFCERTRFAQKLHGFAQQLFHEPQPSENQTPAAAAISMLQRLAAAKKAASTSCKHQNGGEPAPKLVATASAVEMTGSPIRPVLEFLEALTSPAEDGRVLISPAQSTFKYIVLNPGEHFAHIVREARAVIIAGGTMQPTKELKAQLFAKSESRLRVQERIYGHVVPSDAVLPFVLTHGPTGERLCFSFKERSSRTMLNELVMLLQNLVLVVPGGVVCFLPSYEYLERVYIHLKNSGALERISKRKRVFREYNVGSGAQTVEQLLQAYAAAIHGNNNGGGALLLSVVGGKLSEGLNFADDLGRAVIVVGLPYAKRQTLEMQERMEHLNSQLGAGAGNEYYENLCMKAVNQCIGRAVRHIRDYACVYLVDERYSSVRIQSKLPGWIASVLKQPLPFGAVQASTAKFFKSKRKIEA